jgi:hypothetical protein
MVRIKISVFIMSLVLAAACGKAPETINTNAQQANTAAANTANVPLANVPTAPGGNTAVNGSVKPPTETGAAPKTFSIPEKDGPAPDDSDIKSALGENFVQTRTFHSHAQLDKVEKTTVIGSEAKTSIKVYLKNGQVKEIGLKNALTAPAADILKAIH